VRVNGGVLDKQTADVFAQELDLASLPACPMCLLDVAWAVVEGRRVWPATITKTVCWVWPEIESAIRAEVIDARMREVPGAENALRDIAELGAGSPLARVIVEALVHRMADELRARQHD
jgi:hypothetical protein